MSFATIELASIPNAPADSQRTAAMRDGSGPGVIILGGAQGALAVARSLGRKGIAVWFIGDDHPLPRYSRYVRRRLRWNRAEPEAAIEMLCGLAETGGCKGWVLFPAGDAEVQLVAQHHARLAAHFRLFTRAWERSRWLNEKSVLYALAAELGVAFPRGYGPGTVPEAGDFPVIIKPVSSERPNALTKAKAWLVSGPDELAARFDEAEALMGADRVVVQEMIPGDGSTQFSYAGVWDNGRELAFLTARRTRQFPIDFGMTSTFVEAMTVPEVADAARRILAGVGFHGLVEVEFKYDRRDGGYKVLDANTRAWAWIGLGSRAGVDFPYLAWRLAAGRQIAEGVAARPARWIYPSRDLLAIFQAWKRLGKLDVRALGAIFTASSLANFAWDDPLPGVVDLPIQARRFLRRRRSPRK